MRQREMKTARFQQRTHAFFCWNAVELAAGPQTETGTTGGMAMPHRAPRHGDIQRLARGRPHHPQVIGTDGLLQTEMEDEDLDLLVGHMHLVGTTRDRADKPRGREVGPQEAAEETASQP